jgi:hypothetical protein
MDEAMNQNDHDLLIAISIGQQDLKSDMRAMSDVLTEMKRSLDTTNQRQSDLEARMTNISGTVQRSLADQRDDHADIAALKADTTRWKLYGKIALVLGTPVYVGLLALVIEAAKRGLGL